jgi:outer membrane biosynthesis protein TonB
MLWPDWTTMRAAGDEVLIVRRWHLIPAGLIIAAMLALLLHVEAERARDTRRILGAAAMDRFDRIQADMLTREQVRQVATRTARLEAPTEDDLIHLLGHVDEVCLSATCKARFARTVRNLVRVENGAIVPALPGSPPAAAPRVPVPRPAPRPPVAPRPVPPPRPPAPTPRPDPRIDELARDVAALRREVDRLRSHEQDSAILNGLDNRVAALERGLAGVGRTVDSVRAALCAPAVARLLTALRICP